MWISMASFRFYWFNLSYSFDLTHSFSISCQLTIVIRLMRVSGSMNQVYGLLTCPWARTEPNCPPSTTFKRFMLRGLEAEETRKDVNKAIRERLQSRRSQRSTSSVFSSMDSSKPHFYRGRLTVPPTHETGPRHIHFIGGAAFSDYYHKLSTEAGIDTSSASTYCRRQLNLWSRREEKG